MKFKIVKRFTFDYLGDEWKDAYINFVPMSMSDAKKKLPLIANLETKGGDIEQGMDALLELVTSKFIDGKALDDTGTLKDLTASDLQDLPVDTIGRIFTFLSASEVKPSIAP